MSDNKDTNQATDGLAAQTAPDAPFTGGKSAKSKKPLLLALIAVVVLAGLGAGGYVWWQHHGSNDKKTATTKDNTAQSNQTTVSPRQQSEQFISLGAYDDGQNVLLEQLKSAKTDDEKISLYMQLATNAFNAQKYSEANDYCTKALDIQKSSSVYTLLAQSTAAAGNTTAALDYAKKAKETLDVDAPGYNLMLKDADALIEEISR